MPDPLPLSVHNVSLCTPSGGSAVRAARLGAGPVGGGREARRGRHAALPRTSQPSRRHHVSTCFPCCLMISILDNCVATPLILVPLSNNDNTASFEIMSRGEATLYHNIIIDYYSSTFCLYNVPQIIGMVISL